jgi:hypothetical protein
MDSVIESQPRRSPLRFVPLIFLALPIFLHHNAFANSISLNMERNEYKASNHFSDDDLFHRGGMLSFQSPIKQRFK